ncbi:MAG: hypothetical protein LQ341_003345 [Variospora aurantia]|nr:MAG: hypothetical protein LQ341_003345 [Variospora aurantia]
MCYGPLTTYQKCGHHKYTIESPCDAGRDKYGKCRRSINTATRALVSSTPSLCVNCYRRHVDDMIARYRRLIRRLDQEIFGLTQAIDHDQVGGDPARTADLVETRSQLEVDRGELVDEKIAKLEQFRVDQGVWGDGGIWEGYRPFGPLSAAE